MLPMHFLASHRTSVIAVVFGLQLCTWPFKSLTWTFEVNFINPSCWLAAQLNSPVCWAYENIAVYSSDPVNDHLGFGERLLNEVRKLGPRGRKIRIHAPPDRQFTTWAGGCVWQRMTDSWLFLYTNYSNTHD